MITVSALPPSKLATKRLKFTTYADSSRKLQISTNWLPLFLFEKGVEVVERPLESGRGICVELASNLPAVFKSVKHIYSRTYPNRRNNPFEVTYEIRSQKLLDKCFSKLSSYAHITFTAGRLYIREVVDIVAERIAKLMTASDPLTAFCACTSGIDAHATYKQGFTINSILEWRPGEKRDKNDLTETGALSAIANVPCKTLFNEDITTIDTGFLKWATKDCQSTLFTISLQCDDLSNVKANSLKEKSLESGESSLSMFYDGLRIIEALRFPAVLLEQVPSFRDAQVGRVWDLRLRQFGYTTFDACLDARDFGGLSSRKRYFHFATLLSAPFSFPEPTSQKEKPVWDLLVAPRLSALRNVTHSKSLQDGLSCGRLRVITPNSTSVPTLLKSQRRMAKDSVVCQLNDQLYMPDLDMERSIMGIPDEFNLDVVGTTIASEIVGQGVDYDLYGQIIKRVKQHVLAFVKNTLPTCSHLLQEVID